MSTENKHFKYEGNVEIKSGPQEAKVLGIQYLVPAKIDMIVDGKKTKVMADMDSVGRRVYFKEEKYSKFESQVLDYLDNYRAMPEEEYEASDEIYEQVSRARKAHKEYTDMDIGE